MKYKTNRVTYFVIAALLAVGLAALWGGLPVIAQGEVQPPGPSAQNCYSSLFPAASACDRIATGASYSQPVGIAVTSGATGLTPQTCYSTRYHAASNCDRLSSGW